MPACSPTTADLTSGCLAFFDVQGEDLSGSIVWSSDVDGVLGTGSEVTHFLSPGPHQTTAIVTEGGLVSSATIPVSTILRLTAVAGGYHHSLALDEAGDVWAWGSNGNNRLSLPFPAIPYRDTPWSVTSLPDASAVAAGVDPSLVVAADHGSTGVWQMASSAEPVSGISDVTAVAVGSFHVLAERADGTAWAWGLNNFGQLGDGTTTTRLYTPERVAAP